MIRHKQLKKKQYIFIYISYIDFIKKKQKMYKLKGKKNNNVIIATNLIYIIKGSNMLVYINSFCKDKKDSEIKKNNSILYSKKVKKIKNKFNIEYINLYLNSMKCIIKFNFFI